MNPPDVALVIPDMGYAALLPIVLIFVVAVLGVLVEAFVPGFARRSTHLSVSLAGLVLALLALLLQAGDHAVVAAGAIAVDGVTQFVQGTIVLLAVLGVLLIAERESDPGGAFTADAQEPNDALVMAALVADEQAADAQPRDEQAVAALAADEQAVDGLLADEPAVSQRVGGAVRSRTEVFPLFMFAVGGMLLFPAANDLLTLFVALEVLSLPLYLLCGLARRRQLLSQEAAMKYFLLGSVSSAIFLFGIALLYGYAGTLNFGPHLSPDGSVLQPGIAEVISTQMDNQVLLYAGMALMLVGLLFKVSAVPFHWWAPDVYEGAPTPITAVMASAVKVSAVVALMRVLYVTFGGLTWDYTPLLWVVAILTMIGGSLLALTQTDVKRMLAYSSVAHAGFLLVGLVAASPQGIASVLFYLLAYGFVTVGAFALLTVVRSSTGEATHLSQWAGLGRRSPVVASLFGLFLMAMAGIPLTSGFIGKFAVFRAAVEADAVWLVVAGVVASAIAAFFYLRVIVMMFFAPPTPDAAVVVLPSALTTVVVTCAVVVTVLLGVAPQALLNVTTQSATLLR